MTLDDYFAIWGWVGLAFATAGAFSNAARGERAQAWGFGFLAVLMAAFVVEFVYA